MARCITATHNCRLRSGASSVDGAATRHVAVWCSRTQTSSIATQMSSTGIALGLGQTFPGEQWDIDKTFVQQSYNNLDYPELVAFNYS